MKKEFGMNMENADLTKKARTALDDMWGEAILAALLVQGVSFGFGCVQTALGSGGDDVSISALVIACLVGLFGVFVPVGNGSCGDYSDRRVLRALVCSSDRSGNFSGAFVFHDFLHHDGRRIH